MAHGTRASIYDKDSLNPTLYTIVKTEELNNILTLL